MTLFPLNLYTIDIKYIRNLHNIDNNVMSVSPQIGKNSRPFLGIIVMCNNFKYCIPLSKPKEKHTRMRNKIDFKRIIINNELIGVLNFNQMIPIEDKQIKKMDIVIRKHDNQETRNRKELLSKELLWCNDHFPDICNTANVLYNKYISGEYFSAKPQCLNFPKLETECVRYNSK